MAKKVAVVAVVVPTYKALPQIVDTIRNAVNSIRQTSAKPVFIVVHNKPISQQLKKKVWALRADTNFLGCKGKGLGKSMIAGFDRAQKRADIVSMLPDDFNFEAHSLSKIVKPVLTGKFDFVNSSWPYHDTSFAASFPKAQYLTETTVSKLLTLANPNFHPQKMGLMPALQQAQREGKLLQSYTGLLCLRTRAWPSVRKTLKTIFRGNARDIDSWGFEPALMLAVLATGKRAGIVPAPRLYEHDWPTKQTIQAQRNKRLVQFKVATNIIQTFLIKTGQQKKLELFKKIVMQTKQRIESATHHQKPLAWTRLRRMRKRRRFTCRFAAIRRTK